MYYLSYHIYPYRFPYYYNPQQPYYFYPSYYSIPTYDPSYQTYSTTRNRAIPVTYPNPNSYGLWNPLGEIWKSFEDAWHKMEVKWHQVWKHVVDHSHVPTSKTLPKTGTVIVKKYIYSWAGETEKLVQSEVRRIGQQASQAAIDKWNSLGKDLQDQAAAKWKDLKKQAGDWVEDEMGGFVYRMQELAMEVFDALHQIEEILANLRQLKSLIKPCSSNVPLTKSLIDYKIQVPLIDKTYRLNMFLCYPPNSEGIIGDIFEKCVKHLQGEAEITLWIKMAEAMGASGGTGVLAGLVNGVTDIVARAPKVFMDCVIEKAKNNVEHIPVELHLKFG